MWYNNQEAKTSNHRMQEAEPESPPWWYRVQPQRDSKVGTYKALEMHQLKVGTQVFCYSSMKESASDHSDKAKPRE